MKQIERRDITKGKGWLLFFYSVPSRPVSSRMKIWRKLSKAGAVQIKGAVYILPMNEEHYEFFQWLVSEVSSVGGEAAFTRVGEIDSMKDHQIIELFVHHSEQGYQTIEKDLWEIETRINSIRKGSRPRDVKVLVGQMAKLSKGIEEIRKTDFFSSKAGTALQEKTAALHAAIKSLAGAASVKESVTIPQRKISDYQGRTWITRRRPYVDRMASAWLIRKFIDKKAAFEMLDEKDLGVVGRDKITFDMSGGVFTHVGDLCTFEVLVRSFGLKDKAVKKIAEVVHELDVKDDRYRNPEAKGIEEILSGLRKSVKGDRELLEKGMDVFEMLYLSKADH